MDQGNISSQESIAAQGEPKPAAEAPKKVGKARAKTREVETAAGTGSDRTRPKVRPHAFVIMPFGKKKGAGDTEYNFDAIYKDLIEPTLTAAGFDAFRADEATTSGDILTDMFQELLLADLCIVDMSIDNANVFYELGIRHAFRKRGVVHIQAGRAYMPFDVFNVRTIPYHINESGVPDSKFLEKDKAAIARVLIDTWASDLDSIHSPIFNLLDGLKEPDRKTLRTPLAKGYWRELDEWKQRVTIAERQKQIGDILLLTEEISNPFFLEEAITEAGKALKNMGHDELALNQFRRGLEVNARNLFFRREEAFHLNRLKRVDEAIVKIESLIGDIPNDSDAISYLGKIYKEMWIATWETITQKEKRLKSAFDAYQWLLKSIATYMKAYRVDLNQYYPGINALTLSSILLYLADQFEDKKSLDPEIGWVRENIGELRGSLIFALESMVNTDKADYWSLVSLAELTALTAHNTQDVVREYRKAMTASRRNTFFLNSSLAQLEMLKKLDLRTEFVQAGIRVVQEELRLTQKETSAESNEKDKPDEREGRVFLFTGYMINKLKKKTGHFPPDKEEKIKEAIRAVLEKHKAGPNDLAVTAGLSAGSEIIFVERCVDLGIPVQAYFPTRESDFIKTSVRPCGENWVERFYKMRNHTLVDEFFQPTQVGSPKPGDDLLERNNRWALYSAWCRGIDQLWLVAVWDGKGEAVKDPNARAVKHMVDLMRDMGGQIEDINTTKLPGAAAGKSGPVAAKPSKKKPKSRASTRKK